MNVRTRSLCLAPLSMFLLTGCEHPAMAPPPAPMPMITALRSPWDAMPVAVTAAPFQCSPAMPMSPDILVTSEAAASSPRLSDEVRQAVYAESDQAVRDLTERTAAAADAYRSTGSGAAAQCVVSLLADAARQHAMAGFMASPQAWQEQNTALRMLAVAYLKVRGSGMMNPAESSGIQSWLRILASNEIDTVQRSPCDNRSCDLHAHQGLSVAVAAAAVAIAANDHALFRFAQDQYREGVREIDARGMLPRDTHGAYALAYNLIGTADLVQLAELGEVNGEPLYIYDNGRIHLLIHTVTRALVDAAPYAAAAGAEQKTEPSIEPWEISWASVYNRRFPDPLITSLLQQVGPAGADMWAV